MAEPVTPKVQVRRHSERGKYEDDVIRSLLEEGTICHVACVSDGSPRMIPTAYGVEGDRLYLHGAAGNFLLNESAGTEVVVTVTLTDGLVLARSVFNHSLNYRSVVIYGRATEIEDPADKRRALEVVVDHLVPGRSSEARPPTEIELKKTRVLSLPITESSAKVRSGGPIDQPEDVDLPVWAGVLPLRTVAGDAVPDPGNQEDVPPPAGLNQPRWS